MKQKWVIHYASEPTTPTPPIRVENIHFEKCNGHHWSRTCGRLDISFAYVQVTRKHFNTESVVISVTTVNYINGIPHAVYFIICQVM